VTISAFELAFYMGFSEIYLLGIDNNYKNEVNLSGKKVVHKDIESYFKSDKINFTSEHFSPIETITKTYEVAKRYADSHNIKVYNCTRGGKLEVFERKNLDDVI
jgi:hypothetical protein